MLAFEAVFIGLLLMTSIAFVVTMPTQGPTPSINAARAPLEAQVKDLLVALEDIPTADRYQNLLQRAIAKAAQGNTSGFETIVDRTMPPGAECRLWLDNGHQRRLVAGPSERLARESVSQSVLWRSTWAYGFVLPSLEVVGELQPLPLQGYQVAQGSLVKEHGVPITATLTTSQGVYDRAALAGVRAGPTASLYMLTEGGDPGFAYTDPALSWQTTPVHARSVAGNLSAGSFDVPNDQRFLNLTVYITGTPAPDGPVATTIVLRDPDGTDHVLPVLTPEPAPGTLSIAFPLQGSWTYDTTDALPTTLSRLYTNASALEGATNWTFVVKEEGTGALPSGTKLTITLPSILTGIDRTNATQAGWRNISGRDDLDRGAEVTAELDGALSNGERSLSVTARRPSGGDALYQVTASLSQGASGRATFVLGATTGIVGTANPLDHEVYLSVPKPQAPGSNATWGVLFPHPKTVPGPAETLQKLDLRVMDGTPLFAGLQGLTPTTGWELVSATHARWTGSISLAANKAQDFTFRVQAPAQRTPDEPAIAMPVQFFGDEHMGAPGATNFSMLDHERPYIHAFNVPPSRDALGNPQKGYHRPSGAPDDRSDSNVNLTGIIRGMLAGGSASYGVTAWGSLTSLSEAMRSGMARSHLDVSRQSVFLGDAVNVTVDFQGLFDEVALAATPPITSWNVEVMVFDPAQPFESYDRMVPSFRGRFGAGADLTFELDPPSRIEAIDPWNLTSDVFGVHVNIQSRAKADLSIAPGEGSFYGPHAIVAQANFVINDASGTQMVQSARQLALVDVLPDSGASGSALYWATLECWLPGW